MVHLCGDQKFLTIKRGLLNADVQVRQDLISQPVSSPWVLNAALT